MGAGRPSSLTPEVQQKICAALRDGCYLDTAASWAGINRVTLYRWLKRGAAGEPGYDDFCNAARRASAEAEIGALRQINEAAKKDWRAAAWFLSRRFPRRWGGGDRREAQMEEIPEETGVVFDPSLLTVPELKQLSELTEQVKELHDKGLPADVLEAEFTVLHEKGRAGTD